MGDQAAPLEVLEWRGLIAHSTDRDALREALTSGSVRFYVGFDPTAPSLHMGNLVQILTMRRIQQAGKTMQLDVMQGPWVSDMLLEAGRRSLSQ